MLTIEESQELIEKFIELREKSKGSQKDYTTFKDHEKICIEKFKYLILMKTGRYKSFSNYEDLNQEGYEALLKAMKNYNPKKGIFFYWAHKYIGTRISRNANQHTAIRYPLKVAKLEIPHKEFIMPLLIEEKHRPDRELENCQIDLAIKNSMSKLNNQQKQIIDLAFGMDDDKPMAISKICNRFNITRVNCIKIIDKALSVMKENIKI